MVHSYGLRVCSLWFLIGGFWLVNAWLQAGFNGITADPVSLNPLRGNIGIGTYTPAALLHTFGNITGQGDGPFPGQANSILIIARQGVGDSWWAFVLNCSSGAAKNRGRGSLHRVRPIRVFSQHTISVKQASSQRTT
jgi:hypothetical protein